MILRQDAALCVRRCVFLPRLLLQTHLDHPQVRNSSWMVRVDGMFVSGRRRNMLQQQSTNLGRGQGHFALDEDLALLESGKN